MARIGVGIDLVEIHRCLEWSLYSDKLLRRLFSGAEIEYCRSAPSKSAQAARFAARFAAKEAWYKALGSYGIPTCSFVRMVSSVSIVSGQNRPPLLKIDWVRVRALTGAHFHIPSVSLSMTHSATTAGAVVVISEPSSPSSPSH